MAYFLHHDRQLKALSQILIVCGWSQTNVGLMLITSRHSSTGLSRSLAVVRGRRHSTAFGSFCRTDIIKSFARLVSGKAFLSSSTVLISRRVGWSQCGRRGLPGHLDGRWPVTVYNVLQHPWDHLLCGFREIVIICGGHEELRGGELRIVNLINFWNWCPL